jgi:nicotinate-nucleotide pyrophosphorylase (carboxylating)
VDGGGTIFIPICQGKSLREQDLSATSAQMLASELRRHVQAWLEEDIGPGDITTACTVPSSTVGIGRVKAKQSLVLSGVDLIPLVFAEVGVTNVRVQAQDGEALRDGTLVAEAQGSFAALLQGERLALNLLMRLSGVATLTRAAVHALEGGDTRVLDTRKTTPGLRWLEKRAVRHGGGTNHRHHLGDGILIKDNHIAAAGSAAEAIKRCKEGAHHLLKIECEIQHLEQIEEAIGAGADVLLLDNMDDHTLLEAVRLTRRRALTEASGNMSLERLARIKSFGLDFVSMGALTHSAIAADLSMKIERIA